MGCKCDIAYYVKIPILYWSIHGRGTLGRHLPHMGGPACAWYVVAGPDTDNSGVSLSVTGLREL
jgi:hypothetical protein